MRRALIMLSGILLMALLPVFSSAFESSGAETLLETVEHRVYITGSDDNVRPGDPLTRAETAKIVYSLLSEEPEPPVGGNFTDVVSGKWYQVYVDALSEMGVLNGYGELFKPNNYITRAEFVTVLSRLFARMDGESAFSDVSLDHWAYEAVANAVAKGWVNGYGDGSFRPGNNITRAEAVTVVNRALGRSADKEKIDTDGKILQFIDLSYDHWAYYNIMEASVTHEYETAEDGERWLTYEVPKAQRDPGYYNVGGELYKVDDSGHYARNINDGVLQFDGRGRYTTGNAELDAALTNVVKTYVSGGLRNESDLRKLYEHVKKDYGYLASKFMADGAVGWEPEAALTMLKLKKGNCYSYAALFTMLARKLGYQAVGVSGYIRADNWGWDEHGWVRIDLDGKAYICDPEFEGVYAVNNHLNWDLFMKQYGTTPSQYRVNGTVLG